MCCCQFKGSCEAEKSKGKRGSTVLRIYHLAAISLQKMPGSVEGPGKPFPFLLLHDARLRPALVQVTLSSVLPCHDAPNLIPHHVQEPCQEKPSRQRRWALARSTTCSPMTALGQRPATLQPDWIAWLCQPAAHIMHSPGENLSESDSSDKQNKTKQRISFATFLHVTFEFSSWQLFTSLPWLWLAEVMFRLQQEPRRTAAQKGLLQPPALIKPHGYASRTRALIQLPVLGAGPTTPCWRGNPKNKPNWSISSKQLCQFSHETGNTRFYL